MKLLNNNDESLNPLLSAVNLVDVFLVIIATLIIFISQNSLNPFNNDNVTVVKNAGKQNMEIIVKKGKKIKKYKSKGEISQGNGKEAGVAYMLKNGSIIYVPK